MQHIKEKSCLQVKLHSRYDNTVKERTGGNLVEVDVMCVVDCSSCSDGCDPACTDLLTYFWKPSCKRTWSTVMYRMLWVMYDPEKNSWQEGLPIAISKTLKRRYFLVEKAKNANVIGMAQHLPSWHQVSAQSILTESAGCTLHIFFS